MKKAKTKADNRAAAEVAKPLGAGLKTWHSLAALGAALVAAFVAYGPALRGPFVLDDLYLPFTGQEFAAAPLAHWIAGVRPLLMFSFWVNYRLSGMETFSYHATNVLLHVGAAFLCFLIARRIIGFAGESGSRRDGLAAFAAAIFLLHPIQTESVAYVASRSETLSVLLMYAAFVLFLYRLPGALSWLRSLAVLALFGLAVTTKEHTAVLPALLLLTDYWWNPGFSFRGVRRNWKVYVLILAGGAAAAGMVWKVLRNAQSAGFGLKEFTWYQYFYTQCRAIWVYIRLFFFPAGQNIDPDFPISHTPLEYGAIVGMLGLAALAAAAIYYRRRFPLASYGYLAFLILLAPTSSVMPIADPVAERRMYLPLVGLLLVIVDLFRHWKTSSAKSTAAMAAVVAVLAMFTYNRSRVWASDMALWTDAVSKSPAKSRPNFQLAFAYYAQGRCAEALPYYATAGRTSADVRLLIDWAAAYDCVGNHAAALEKLRQAAVQRPSAHIYSLIGFVYRNDRNPSAALEALKVAERMDPGFVNTYICRAAVYDDMGNPQGAIDEYKRALAIEPGNQDALQGLSLIEQRFGGAR